MSYRLVILGASSVGKSSIVRRALGDDWISKETTIVASYWSIQLKDLPNLACWELAGFERWQKLAPLYYNNANAALIVYDVRCPESLVTAKEWIKELRLKLSKDLVIALAGNKVELWDTLCIDPKEVQNYALQQGIIFMEISAQTGHNIPDIFVAIGKELKAKQVLTFNYKKMSKNKWHCRIL